MNVFVQAEDSLYLVHVCKDLNSLHLIQNQDLFLFYRSFKGFRHKLRSIRTGTGGSSSSVMIF